MDDGTFYLHHTLKVLPSDALAVLVTQDRISRHHSILAHLPVAPVLWQDVTAQEEIKTLLLECNK